MSWEHVQALLLRPARADSVAHFVLRVAPGQGGQALKELQGALDKDAPLALGADVAADRLHCTLGFTYRGLEMLGLPPAYLRVFSRLSPAFSQGAPLRAARLGDSGPSAPARWSEGFALDNAHVLISLHGSARQLQDLKEKWTRRWPAPSPGRKEPAMTCMEILRGDRLGAPKGQTGQWVHFGFRDGLTDHHIVGFKRPPSTKEPRSPLPEPVEHAAGEFLLGHVNNSGFNDFCLPLAPQEVRKFFHDSSFGALRPMRQDVNSFQQGVVALQRQAEAVLGTALSADWVKAKLCGRWPGGEALRPGQGEPKRDDMLLEFEKDADGAGCPWFSHVRRMDARGHAGSEPRQRSLLRRGMPFGPANWEGRADGQERGLLGFFFCASLEDQFEQLLGQWANANTRGAPIGNQVCDPLAGQHEGSGAEIELPLGGGCAVRLSGFKPWTRTLGTLYSWHPSAHAIDRLLREDYLPAKEGGPWL